MKLRHGIRSDAVAKPLAHEVFVQAQPRGFGRNSGQTQCGGDVRRLRDVKFNHVVKASDADTLLEVADSGDEFRQRTREIKPLDDHELRDIAEACLAVCVHENAQAQSALLQVFKLAAPHHAEEQHDAGLRGCRA